MKKNTTSFLLLFWYILAVFIILAAVCVSIASLLTPILNGRVGLFETWASEALHSPVTINTVELSWHHLEPMIVLKKVVVFDAITHQRRARIQHVLLNMSIWKSIWERQVIWDDVTITGSQLVMNQQPITGHFNQTDAIHFITDRVFMAASLPVRAMLQKSVGHPGLIVRDMSLIYTKANGQIQRFAIPALTMTEQALQGEIILQQALPTKVSIHLTWLGHYGDAQIPKARVYLYIEGLALEQWLSNVEGYGYQIKAGVCSAQLWADWNHGQWQQLQATAQLYNLQFLALKTNHLEVISRLKGTIGWRREGTNQVLVGENIFIDFPDHLWQGTGFSMQFNPAVGTLQKLNIAYLDGGDVQRILSASTVNLAAKCSALASLQFTGELRQLALTASGALTQTQNVSIAAHFNDLSVHITSNDFKVENLAGKLNWNGQSLVVDLESTHARVNSALASPMTFDQITGTAHITPVDNRQWYVETDKLLLRNTDVDVTTRGNVIFDVNDVPIVDLTVQFQVANVAHITHYLPLAVFNPALREWFHTAFNAGQIESGMAQIQGRLDDFPFEHSPGKFTLIGKIKDISLVYVPNWPVLQHAMGTIAFTKSTLTVALNGGMLEGIPIVQAQAIIPTLAAKAPAVLALTARLAGEIADGYSFIQTSPLHATLGQALAGIAVHGPMAVLLKLRVPLKTPAETTSSGIVSIQNTQVALPAWHIDVKDATGNVKWADNQLSDSRLTGVFLDELATLHLKTVLNDNDSPSIQASLTGHVSATTLENWLSLPITKVMSGKTDYRAHINFTGAAPSSLTVHVFSELQGMHVNLPVLFNKTSQQVKPLVIDMRINQQRIAAAQVDYDNSLHALVTPGIIMAGNIPALQIDFDHKDFSGQIRAPTTLTPPVALLIDLKRCYLDAGLVTSRQTFDFMSLPALDFTCRDFQYGDKALGAVAFKTAPGAQGINISSLTLLSPLLSLHAHGRWTQNNGLSVSHFQGSATTTRLSELLNYWGVDATDLIASHGAARFNLRWPNTPYQASLTQLKGNVSLLLKQGRIINISDATNAKLGIGRMLNVFSLKTIPRRLNLDFSDLSEKGYSFDSITGSLKLDEGMVSIPDIQIDGPIARLNLLGRIGILDKDCDMYLSVTPYVTSSLPIVATLAGGPVAGALTWLIDNMVSPEVSRVTMYQYAIRGPWSNPAWQVILPTDEKAHTVSMLHGKN